MERFHRTYFHHIDVASGGRDGQERHATVSGEDVKWVDLGSLILDLSFPFLAYRRAALVDAHNKAEDELSMAKKNGRGDIEELRARVLETNSALPLKLRRPHFQE